MTTPPTTAIPPAHAAPSSPPVLSLRNLTKAYDSLVAVKDLSLDLPAGEILGLVGPNGAGKTTTMRCIAGVIAPSSGSITVAGFDVLKQPVSAKRSMAYVPDDPKLFEAMTIDEHLRFAAAAYNVPDWQAKAEDLLWKFDLTPKRNTLTMELSRGMRQKAAVCCAYLHDPKLVFLDEPLTGLDPYAIRAMKDSIREHAARGASVVISSHLLSLVEDLCTSLLIMVKGTMRFYGPLREARAAFAQDGTDASLEEVFFRAVDGQSPSAAPISAAPATPGISAAQPPTGGPA